MFYNESSNTAGIDTAKKETAMNLTVSLNNRPITIDLSAPLAVCAETTSRVMEAVTQMHIASNNAGVAWCLFDRVGDNDDFVGLWSRNVEFFKGRISSERRADAHVTTYVDHDLLGDPEPLRLFDELVMVTLNPKANASIVLLTTAPPHYCPGITGSERVLHFDGDEWQLDNFDLIHI